MKKAVMIMLMVVMFIAGGMVFAECSADEIEPEVVTEEATEAPEAEEPEEPEIVEQEEPEIIPEAEDMEIIEDEPAGTPEEIIAEDTGLQVDKVKQVDAYGTWAFYEVFADGDIYAVTIKDKHVDVCVILN